MGALTIIAILIAASSALGMIFVLGRHLRQVAIIDIETIPKERESKIKQDLLLQRFERRRERIIKKASLILGPFWKIIRYGFERLFAWANELEAAHKVKKAKKIVMSSSTPVLLAEARRFADNGDFKEAEEKYIEILKADPKYPAAYKGLGELYMAKKDYLHAKETLEFLIKLGQADATIYARLGAVAKELGNMEEAKEDLLKSISLETDLMSAYVDLGLVYQSLREHEKAMEAFAKAVEIEPSNPRNLDLMLEESIMVGNKNMAEEAFIRLREANPENQKLKEFRKKIDEIK
ncbi:tetratricopeptide repeat protein [Candidatus Uhrbacteria bacterium]|nr:tetratricopeptide repeat protein [Candidatus Uhrbacteria bacterium]